MALGAAIESERRPGFAMHRTGRRDGRAAAPSESDSEARPAAGIRRQRAIADCTAVGARWVLASESSELVVSLAQCGTAGTHRGLACGAQS